MLRVVLLVQFNVLMQMGHRWRNGKPALMTAGDGPIVLVMSTWISSGYAITDKTRADDGI